MLKNRAIKVMLVEDNPEYRHVISLIMEDDPDLELITTFGAAEPALRSLQNMSTRKVPDVILLDLNLPGMSGLDALPEFSKQIPDSKIILLTQSDKEIDVLSAVSGGIDGYLLKSSSSKQIINSIREVGKGGAQLDPKVSSLILHRLKTLSPKKNKKISLSKREQDVLHLLSDGLLQKEIAGRLNLSVNTVVTHIRRIYQKLNANNAASAVHRAYSLGILKSDKALHDICSE